MALTFAPVARAADSTATASTSSTLTLSASSDVLADHCNGGWTTGTHVAESLDFYDTGNTHVYLEGHEHISTGCGFSVYAGGVGVQPDLSKLLKKTNISTDNLSVAFHVAMGNGLPTSGSGSHISALVGGVVKYRATTSLSWNALQVQWVRYGSTNVAAISTGFSYVFGQ